MSQTLHIVDDNSVTRRRIRDVVTSKLLAAGITVPVREWKYIWELAAAYAERSLDRDVAICDLFSMRYRSSSPNAPLAGSRPDTAPGSIEDIKWASLDAVLNYFRPVISRGLSVVVYSHVPVVLKEHEDSPGASKLREALSNAGVDDSDIVEKPDLEASADQLAIVAERVQSHLSDGSSS